MYLRDDDPGELTAGEQLGEIADLRAAGRLRCISGSAGFADWPHRGRRAGFRASGGSPRPPPRLDVPLDVSRTPDAMGSPLLPENEPPGINARIISYEVI